MPISYQTGNIFTSSAQTLVVPVNCRGVAGCGLALQFKQRYQCWFQMYASCCRSGILSVGRPLLHWGMEPFILSFPTKDDFRKPSQLAYIEVGLQAVDQLCVKHGLESIAFPKLGTGAGGLSWQQVQPLMEHYLGHVPYQVFIYV